MSIRTELFMIDPENHDSTQAQLRNCICNALKNLDERLKRFESEAQPKDEELGQIMKARRKKMGMTQAEMAMRIGVDRTTIIKWEQTAKRKIQPILEAYGLKVVVGEESE